MWSKNKKSMTVREREHVEKIKSMPCAVCGAPGPSECHEIEQGLWYTSIPLDSDCHRGSVNGLHGQRVMWKIHKKTELLCLNETLRSIFEDDPNYAAASAIGKSSLAQRDEDF